MMYPKKKKTAAVDVAIKAIKWAVAIMTGCLAAALLYMVALWIQAYINPFVLGSGMTVTGMYLLYGGVVLVVVLLIWDRKRRGAEDRLYEHVMDKRAKIGIACHSTQRLMEMLNDVEQKMDMLEVVSPAGRRTIDYCTAYQDLYVTRIAILTELQYRSVEIG